MTRIQRIAVINRGEAASRCLRAVRELRIERGSALVGIALYCDEDRLAPFVQMADESYGLGPALRRTSAGDTKNVYLDVEYVIAMLRRARADSVWPGWGFLAESPEFVERLRDANITFIGPAAETMRLVGDKIRSKEVARLVDVPVVPWSEGPVRRDELGYWSERIGFPLVLKATAGGGGRGIRVVERASELRTAFDSAEAEAKAAFNDGTLFMEACVTGARHIEAQMVADAHGTVQAVGLRDCSVQRKHQKVVEEAPPPDLPEGAARLIRDSSVRLLQHVKYVGVGTCEYLVTRDGHVYFLEVNPRLQVEHGITELLTGLDLVKLQIRVAAGERLPENCPEERGAAIEVRLCAEDPARGFAPSPGRVALAHLPAGPGIRVDAGVSAATNIPAEFDSMIAKVLAYGSTRAEARARLVRALLEARIVIENGATNKGFLLDILEDSDFVVGAVSTAWLGGKRLGAAPEPSVEALAIAAIHSYQESRAVARSRFFAEAARGRPVTIPASVGGSIELSYAGALYRLHVFALGNWTYRIDHGGRAWQVTLREQGEYGRLLITRQRQVTALVASSASEICVELGGRVHRIKRDSGGRVLAPSPCMLIEVAVRAGDHVRVGDRLGLFEAMKCETAFHAAISGVVREVVARPGERLRGGDVILVVEPSPESHEGSSGALSIQGEPDALAALTSRGANLALSAANGLTDAERALAVDTIAWELRRILLGYDVQETRAEQLIELLGGALTEVAPAVRDELARLVPLLTEYADIEVLFSRTPPRVQGEELNASNDARMAMYLRRIAAQGLGIDQGFLERVKIALAHYGVDSLEPGERLERTVLRLYSTRTTRELRNRVATALLKLTIGLAESQATLASDTPLRDALDRLWQLRGTVTPTVADLAAQARFVIFDRREQPASGHAAPEQLALTLVPPPPGTDLASHAAALGVSVEDVMRFELWRLANFELERIALPGFPEVLVFFGRAKGASGDQRFFALTEVRELDSHDDAESDLSAFERRFHAAVQALRAVQGQRTNVARLHWNRITVFVRPQVALPPKVIAHTLRRVAPETDHLGLERVVMRVALARENGAEKTDLIAWNPSGGRVEWSFRTPHDRPLEPASAYERKVAVARARGLTYPYEIVRLFTAAPEAESAGGATAAGRFTEYELVNGRAEPVARVPGNNVCGVVFGVITTPTLKHPEGMRRVLILNDPTFDMGALAAPECERMVAALELAERERLPVEWISVSAGARIAMDSGTENLDATARVVRKIVQLTDAGGEINVIACGVNVGAQSYFDALATMGMSTRGVLIMLPSAALVLTGRAALEASGGVAAEDEIGIGGYERIMGPSGQAHYFAHDLSQAFAILLAHYATSYVAPGERAPRRLPSSDPAARDVTLHAYDGDDGYRTIGDLFSAELNFARKRPFAMRCLMRALADHDGGTLERWRDFRDAQSAIVWDCHVGGFPVTMIGIESRQVPRHGYTPNDGPNAWTAATLFPHSSKKVARALNAASGNRPAVILANLSGFDGSPESMRRGVLEMGSEIARAVVRFSGKILFLVVTRYHGGAYVVFSRELNDELRAAALSGSYASVIGGAAAAAVVFVREAQKRAAADPRELDVSGRLAAATDPALKAVLRAEYDRTHEEVLLQKQHEIAKEFDSIHTVERALRVASLNAIIEPRALRPVLVEWLAEAP